MSQYIDSVATGTYAVNAASSAAPASGALSTASNWLDGLSGFFRSVGTAIITERQVEAQVNQSSAYGSVPTPTAMQNATNTAVSFIKSPLGAVAVAAVAVILWRKFAK